MIRSPIHLLWRLRRIALRHDGVFWMVFLVALVACIQLANRPSAPARLSSPQDPHAESAEGLAQLDRPVDSTLAAPAEAPFLPAPRPFDETPFRPAQLQSSAAQTVLIPAETRSGPPVGLGYGAQQVANWQDPLVQPPRVETLPAAPGQADQAPTRRPGQVEVPLDPTQLPGDGSVTAHGELVSVSVREAPLHAVLSLIAQQQGLSIAASSDLKTPITVTLQPTSLENALDAVLAIAGCTWVRRNEVIYVTPVKKDGIEAPYLQGRELRVFSSNYVAAADVEKVVTGLLSPIGKVFIREVDVKDKRRTSEQVVVDDLPPYLARAAAYIAEIDQPPRQVLVEARLLQVKLERDRRHGVNFEAIAHSAGTDITLKTQGFATGLGPGMVFTVDGPDFDTLVECLTTTTDAKTSAPKLLVLNGQESRIQIGRRLGYFVTTTTQTSTLQDVQFLEVGVVLTVTPYITADGQILMKVRPKVSSGEINPNTTLPEEETTEVETSIMVPDGQGIIIGGLIQELDTERQSKVTWLGDLWMVGRLFQRRVIERERNEVIIALLPRIAPFDACPTPEQAVELERLGAPVVTPVLQSAPRPWEPQLPDAVHNPLWPHHVPFRFGTLDSLPESANLVGEEPLPALQLPQVTGPRERP